MATRRPPEAVGAGGGTLVTAGKGSRVTAATPLLGVVTAGEAKRYADPDSAHLQHMPPIPAQSHLLWTPVGAALDRTLRFAHTSCGQAVILLQGLGTFAAMFAIMCLNPPPTTAGSTAPHFHRFIVLLGAFYDTSYYAIGPAALVWYARSHGTKVPRASNAVRPSLAVHQLARIVRLSIATVVLVTASGFVGDVGFLSREGQDLDPAYRTTAWIGVAAKVPSAVFLAAFVHAYGASCVALQIGVEDVGEYWAAELRAAKESVPLRSMVHRFEESSRAFASTGSAYVWPMAALVTWQTTYGVARVVLLLFDPSGSQTDELTSFANVLLEATLLSLLLLATATTNSAYQALEGVAGTAAWTDNDGHDVDLGNVSDDAGHAVEAAYPESERGDSSQTRSRSRQQLSSAMTSVLALAQQRALGDHVRTHKERLALRLCGGVVSYRVVRQFSLAVTTSMLAVAVKQALLTRLVPT